jgi:hypothetical protein
VKQVSQRFKGLERKGTVGHFAKCVHTTNLGRAVTVSGMAASIMVAMVRVGVGIAIVVLFSENKSLISGTTRWRTCRFRGRPQGWYPRCTRPRATMSWCARRWWQVLDWALYAGSLGQNDQSRVRRRVRIPLLCFPLERSWFTNESLVSTAHACLQISRLPSVRLAGFRYCLPTQFSVTL